MVGEGFFPHFQNALKKLFGFGVIADVKIVLAKIIAGRQQQRVIWCDVVLRNLQHALVQRLCLGIFPDMVVKACKVGQIRCGIEMVQSVTLLRDLQPALEQRFRLSIVTHPPIEKGQVAQ